jgi:hypothetical protein
MESDKIYEESLNEIKHVRKQLAFDTMTVDVSKFDAKTKEAFIYAVSSALADREKQITNILSGVK